MVPQTHEYQDTKRQHTAFIHTINIRNAVYDVGMIDAMLSNKHRQLP